MNQAAFPSSVADAVDRVAPSVVGLRTRRAGLAAGLAWRAGVVVTSASAIGGSSRVQVVLPSGEAVAAAVRGMDPGTDLAVIAIDGELPLPERRLDPPVRLGDFVFAVGRDGQGGVHASFGHVGAVAGPWRSWRGGAFGELVRLDGHLPPGLMGAPIADAQGQVIGIGSQVLARHHAVVVPRATIDSVAEALLAHGRVQRGHLGIAAQAVALSATMRDAVQVDTDAALLVSGVGEDSPAARAGLLVGDLLASAGGRPVPSLEALREVLGAEQIGARLRLVLLRGGQRLELPVEVGELRREARC